MRNVVIAGYVRSPFTPAKKGELAKVRPDDLAAQTVRGLLAGPGSARAEIEDLIVGCAFPEGEQGFNVARIIGFLAELPLTVAGATINRFCGSSMQAIHMAAGAIQWNAGEAFLCAGVESMTRVPMGGFNPLPNPGLIARYPQAFAAMGETAENLARQCKISRERQEQFASPRSRRPPPRGGGQLRRRDRPIAWKGGTVAKSTAASAPTPRSRASPAEARLRRQGHGHRRHRLAGHRRSGRDAGLLRGVRQEARASRRSPGSGASRSPAARRRSWASVPWPRRARRSSAPASRSPTSTSSSSTRPSPRSRSPASTSSGSTWRRSTSTAARSRSAIRSAPPARASPARRPPSCPRGQALRGRDPVHRRRPGHRHRARGGLIIRRDGGIQKVGVLGAGVMGAGIAAHVANAGIPVVLLDIVPEGATDRNVLAAGALERLKKAKPAAFMSQRGPGCVTPGNLEDDLGAARRLRLDRRGGDRADRHQAEGLPRRRRRAQARLDRLDQHLDHPARQARRRSARRRSRATSWSPTSSTRRATCACSSWSAGPATRPEAVAAIRDFCDRRLGKSVVDCKDTPGFIANRVGTFWIEVATREAIDGGLDVEEADAVAGKPMGFPKTGIFGLMDLVGIDLGPHIAASLLATLPRRRRLPARSTPSRRSSRR